MTGYIIIYTRVRNGAQVRRLESACVPSISRENVARCNSLVAVDSYQRVSTVFPASSPSISHYTSLEVVLSSLKAHTYTCIANIRGKDTHERNGLECTCMQDSSVTGCSTSILHMAISFPCVCMCDPIGAQCVHVRSVCAPW